MAQGINATIGYSNPTKVDIQNRMQYYSGENICGKHRIRYAQRGDYARLVDTAGSTDRHETGVSLPLLDLPMHKQYREGTVNTHGCNRCNAQTHDDMTCLRHWNYYNKFYQFTWGGEKIIRQERKYGFIFVLMFSCAIDHVNMHEHDATD